MSFIIHAPSTVIYLVDDGVREDNCPLATFLLGDDARYLFDHLCDRYTGMRFVMTNTVTGESHVG